MKTGTLPAHHAHRASRAIYCASYAVPPEAVTLRDGIPKAHALTTAEFTTIRLRLMKVAARVIETASRVRVAFAASCPEAALFRDLAHSLVPAAP